MAFLRSNLRLVLICAVIGVVTVWGYYTYFSGSSAPVGITQSSGPSAEGADLLAALNSLQGIKLDDSIFRDPLFISLTDYTVSIPPQPIGNPDPFAPFAGGSSAVSIPSNIKSGTAR